MFKHSSFSHCQPVSRFRGDSKMAKEVKILPQKKHYRQRAHSNPLADHTVE